MCLSWDVEIAAAMQIEKEDEEKRETFLCFVCGIIHKSKRGHEQHFAQKHNPESLKYESYVIYVPKCLFTKNVMRDIAIPISK